MMEYFMSNMFFILSILGALAFLVSVITEVTKGLPFLVRIPTDIQVISVSIATCLFAYLSYASFMNKAIVWYYIVGSILASFIVAFISMYGWDKINTLWNRFKMPSSQ